MPKMKTHKGTKKRFRLTAKGKVKHRAAGTSHLAARMSQKRKRNCAARGSSTRSRPPRSASSSASTAIEFHQRDGQKNASLVREGPGSRLDLKVSQSMRTTKGAARNRAKNRLFKKAKGYVGGRRRLLRTAKENLVRAGVYAYRDRRNRKRDFRRLWIIRINAAVRAAACATASSSPD